MQFQVSEFFQQSKVPGNNTFGILGNYLRSFKHIKILQTKKNVFERSLSTSQLPRVKKRQNSQCNLFKESLFLLRVAEKCFP